MLGPAACLLLAVSPLVGASASVASGLITLGLGFSALTLGGVSGERGRKDRRKDLRPLPCVRWVRGARSDAAGQVRAGCSCGRCAVVSGVRNWAAGLWSHVAGDSLWASCDHGPACRQASARARAARDVLARSALPVASHLDIAPRNAGLVFGAGNTAATLAGLVSVPVTGFLLQVSGLPASRDALHEQLEPFATSVPTRVQRPCYADSRMEQPESHLVIRPLSPCSPQATGSWPLVFGITAVHYVAGAVLWAAWCGDRQLQVLNVG
jgi:hypothetical protein